MVTTTTRGLLVRTTSVALLLVAVAAGCGDGRSVSAYCGVFYGDGQQFRQPYLNTSGQVSLAQVIALMAR